jgi:Na+/proline symporter
LEKDNMATTLVWATYVVAAVVVVLFGTAACYLTYIRHKKVGPDTPEFFLTARNSVGTFRIAWSFYAAAMGSWTLFSPAQYAWTAGEHALQLSAASVLLVVVRFASRACGYLLQASMPLRRTSACTWHTCMLLVKPLKRDVCADQH